jgi:hypothetical protein
MGDYLLTPSHSPSSSAAMWEQDERGSVRVHSHASSSESWSGSPSATRVPYFHSILAPCQWEEFSEACTRFTNLVHYWFGASARISSPIGALVPITHRDPLHFHHPPSPWERLQSLSILVSLPPSPRAGLGAEDGDGGCDDAAVEHGPAVWKGERMNGSSRYGGAGAEGVEVIMKSG